jgi:hypothetical protein
MMSPTGIFSAFASSSPFCWRLAKALPFNPDYRQELLRQMPTGARCAEIGVWKGQFSERILETTNPKLLYLVDPWSFQPRKPERRYGGKIAKNQENMDSIFENVRDRFKHLDGVRIHRQTSVDFFEDLEELLDWVYIDGDHSREAVFGDLTRSWQKTTDAGIIAGDDYFWRDVDGTLAVKSAVDEFCSIHNSRKKLIGSQYIIYKN